MSFGDLIPGHLSCRDLSSTQLIRKKGERLFQLLFLQFSIRTAISSVSVSLMLFMGHCAYFKLSRKWGRWSIGSQFLTKDRPSTVSSIWLKSREPERLGREPSREVLSCIFSTFLPR